MSKQLLLFAVTILLFSFSVNAQREHNMKEKYSSHWSKVDSLLNNGLPESATKEINLILKMAQAENNDVEEIKAHLYLLQASAFEENDQLKAIQLAESRIAEGSIAATKALWQSISAELYWRYLQTNRYRIYSRTAVENAAEMDLETWDARAFYKKIAELYLSSLENRTSLRQIPIEKYAPIILNGVNTRHLRPTVYDLLVFRAISFFENDEKDVVRPADQFTIEGNPWFAPATQFSEVKVKVKNDDASAFQALRLYQEVIAFHLNDPAPDALIDADLQRLQFVYNRSVSPDKDSLYENALKKLESTYPHASAIAQVSYTIAQQMMHAGDNSLRRGKNKNKSNRDIPAIKRYLQQIVQKFPKSEGGINASNLLQSIQQPNLSVQAEEVIIPDEYSRVLISYQNLSTVYLKLYRVDRFNLLKDVTNENLLATIQHTSPIHEWQQSLPGSDDMELHSAELPIDPLPTGAYVLVVSSDTSLSKKDKIVAATYFQSSYLSMVVDMPSKSAYLLHRKSGTPLSKVDATFWAHKYNNRTYSYDLIKLDNARSNSSGIITLPKDNEASYDRRIAVISLVSDSDTLYLSRNWDGYYWQNVADRNNKEVTFFFTDRAIYRPGQTIYFKGIMVQPSNEPGSSSVVPNKSTTVTLLDVNRQKVASIKVNTNSFGSFSGTFVAPQGLLTGLMQISNESGNSSFSVEEYKRPKFYVDFDTLKETYSLNETVHVRGLAKAYAGNQIDGASVSYRVVREARFPYYWSYFRWGMPASPPVEIANGVTTTDANGGFELDFITIPDKSVQPESLPIFNYVVYADVTDVNGETRSGQLQINCGYQSWKINADIPEDSKPSELNQLKVSTSNLNDVFVPASVKVSIAKLAFPGLLRKRRWEAPDQFLLSASAFKKILPFDEYREESNYLNWETLPPIYEQTFTTTAQGKISIPETVWKQSGWYLIELTSTDGKGNKIVEKKYTHVWSPSLKGSIEKPIVSYVANNSYQPGEQAEIWLATGVAKPFLLQSEYRSARSITTTKGAGPIRLTIEEQDRGNIGFSWLYVYQNQVFKTSQTVVVPWSNKDLNISWATHRDKLQPGAKEEWTLTIKGDKKEKVAAELLTGMYDASLDAIKPQAWNFNRFTPIRQLIDSWNTNAGFGVQHNRLLQFPQYEYSMGYEKSYDQINLPYAGNMPYGRAMNARFKSLAAPAAPAAFDGGMNEESLQLADNSGPMLAGQPGAGAEINERVQDDANKTSGLMASSTQMPQLRTNLQETAFFFPHLGTDEEGNVHIKFSLPEALTEWKFMALAHTKDWKVGLLEGSIKTQKELMVVPNFPRFLRQNDAVQLSAKITNLSEAPLSGTASIELLDATTLQPIHLPFRLKKLTQTFSVKQGQSTQVAWDIHVPETIYEPVIVRVIAQADNFSDGEQTTLPVVSNRMLVTETFPLAINGSGIKSFSFDKLKQASSSSMTHHALTVEYTGNPAWYAVQALPYLMEYPYECAEQTFNRFYANALAGNIVAHSPKIAEIFNQWNTKDTAALLSNLQKNESLKSALLEETPWVLDAKSEQKQKQRIAALFDAHQLAKGLANNLATLKQMQASDGGFPWFKGMTGNRYITQYILSGLGRLQQLGVDNAVAKDAAQIIERGLHYLDYQIKLDYDNLVKRKAKLGDRNIDNSQVQYLYMRSFFNRPIPAATKKAFDYYKAQASQYWPDFNPYLKGQIALSLYRLGDKNNATKVLASLKETAVKNEEMGMYWAQMPHSYWWYEAPIEAQSLLIEAFHEIAADRNAVDAMKLWLLKQKQTQHWNTTKATADAVYALLLQGSDWLASAPRVIVQLGDTVFSTAHFASEAGTGYFKRRIEGAAVQQQMGAIKLDVQSQGGKEPVTSWGAVYWQYFEDMDKVTSAATPLSLQKDLYIERNTDSGPVLTQIKEGNDLKVGDKVKVRIVVKVDRDMEYVHLKDMRAACFEPQNVLSRYQYQNGLGYYESTKDIATHFFFDYLRKGTYVFEYPVFVSAKGEYSNGIASIQCMYAPEFSSHSQGGRLRVQ